MTGTKIFLAQQEYWDKGEQITRYHVKKIINTLTPKVGEILTVAQVQVLIDAKAHVTIVPLTS